MIAGEAEDALFAGGEPFDTFRKLWHAHSLPYALSGIVLATAYRIDEHRRAV
jgi:hypothetical protein